MATVLPRSHPVASDRVSPSELDVLRRLEALPKDWIVLHSLWLKTHRVKRDAEIDFVVVTDQAVLLLEVKGGNVWRDDDGWHFQPTRGGEETIKREGPIEQVRGAYYALRSHFRDVKRPDLFEEYVWGFGAILPDCTLQVDPRDPGIDRAMILDEREYPSGLDTYLSRLVSYWTARIQGQTHQTGRHSQSVHLRISTQTRQQLKGFLRPKMEQVVGVAAHVANSEREICELTEQQVRALDFAAAEPRNILIGAAGTGKTFLAVEQARRKVEEGQRVLFVCFNSLLARTIAPEFQSLGQEKIFVTNYHQLALRLVRESGRTITFCEGWGDFEKELREHLVDVVSDMQERDRYDYLVMDEAQDLMSESFVDLLDCLVQGGFRSGSWLVAVDTQQAIFRSNFDRKVYDRLCDWGRKTTLDINCRNTREIATYVYAISGGVGSVSVKAASGEMPVVRYYTDKQSYHRLLKKVVNELIQSFVSATMPVSGITILASDKSFLTAEMKQPGFFLRGIRDIDPEDSDLGAIRAGTIQAFKGLESSAVVLVGFEQFDQTLFRDLFYVGASRARAVLRILLPEHCKQVARALPEIVRLLGLEAGTYSSEYPDVNNNDSA